MFRLNENQPLTAEMVNKYITANNIQKARETKLFNYYKGKHNILNRQTEDASKPNNKVVNPYPSYITTLITGYFVGSPITYRSDNTELLDLVNASFNYNDESSNNTELAKTASICGTAYELMYIDSDGELRFKSIDPIGCIPIFDTTLENELLYFIRPYTEYDILNERDIEYIEVYGRTDYSLYCKQNGTLTLINSYAHTFGIVPISIYANNEMQIGDFEPVISLIDAYDNLMSDALNNEDYFSDAYLALYGLMGTDEDSIKQMKQNRVLLMETDSKAEWLTKNVSDTTQENLRGRINEDIHKFSLVPSLTDKDFSQNASGVAIKYKLLGLDDKVATKEAYYKKGLQRRLELMCNYYRLLGFDYDYRDIQIIFTRNIPANITEVASVINQIGNLLSEKTQLAMLPLDIDPETEIAERNKERENGYDLFSGDFE